MKEEFSVDCRRHGSFFGMSICPVCAREEQIEQIVCERMKFANWENQELHKKIAALESALGKSLDFNIMWDGNIAEKQARIAELEQKIEWWGNLVKRECIGTKEIPSLKAYIEGLEQKISELESENAVLREQNIEGVREVNRLERQLAGQKQEVSVEEIACLMHENIYGKPMSEDEPVKNLYIYAVARIIHNSIYGRENGK